MEAIDPRWRKASYSDNGGNCVEVGDDAGCVLVRDTKDRTGPMLRFTPGAWWRFAGQVKRSLASDFRQRLQSGGTLAVSAPFVVSGCGAAVLSGTLLRVRAGGAGFRLCWGRRGI
jgi:hypothetical protein